jgi:hypothetical protein
MIEREKGARPRQYSFALLAFLLVVTAFPHSALADTPKAITSSVCFQSATSVCLANGKVQLALSQPATITSGGGQIVPPPVTIQLDSNGMVPAGAVIWASDQLTPRGTGYTVTITQSNGLVVSKPGVWVIQGIAPIDISQIAPSAPAVSYPPVVTAAGPVVIGDCSTWATNVTLSSFPCLGGAVTLSLETPAPTDSGTFQWEPKNPLVLKRIACSTDVGSASVNLEVRTESAPNSTGTAVLSVPLTCVPTTATTTTFATASIPAQSPVALLITGVSGNPGIVRVNAQY